MAFYISELQLETRAVHLVFEPDIWGSVEIRIRFSGRHSLPKRRRPHRIIIWNDFRSSMAHSKPGTLTSNILPVMQRATRTITLPVSLEVSDVKYANLRAARRRAQRMVQRTGLHDDYVEPYIGRVPPSYYLSTVKTVAPLLLITEHIYTNS